MAKSRISFAKDDVESMCPSTRGVTVVSFGTKLNREIRLEIAENIEVQFEEAG